MQYNAMHGAALTWCLLWTHRPRSGSHPWTASREPAAHHTSAHNRLTLSLSLSHTHTHILTDSFTTRTHTHAHTHTMQWHSRLSSPVGAARPVVGPSRKPGGSALHTHTHTHETQHQSEAVRQWRGDARPLTHSLTCFVRRRVQTLLQHLRSSGSATVRSK
jgi:hypothetical protein